MSTALPDLWLDWCEVTGTDTACRDDPTIQRFTRQTQPARAVLHALTVTSHPVNQAPAWPDRLGDAHGLQRLMRRGSAVHDHPDTSWTLRLQTRRLLMTGVLIAPLDQGGLGLSRATALGLRPSELVARSHHIGTADDPRACPACSIRSWCQVLGENSGWSRASVRALGYVVPDRTVHRHALTGHGGLGRDWLDVPGLLPAIDRWGYIDLYASIHPSSLSVLIRAAAELAESPIPTDPDDAATASSTPGSRQHIDADEEAQILARADELNRRIAELLADNR